MFERDFRIVHRYCHFDLDAIVDMHNTFATAARPLGPKLSIDDDVEKCFTAVGSGGVRGFICHNPRKADRTGVPSWQIVDEWKYCGHLEFGFQLKRKYTGAATDDPLNQWLLKYLLSRPCIQRHHFVYIDRGLLGSYETAMCLITEGHVPSVSCPVSRPEGLWRPLQQACGVGTSVIVYGQRVAAVVMQPKKGRFFNLLTSNNYAATEHTYNVRRHSESLPNAVFDYRTGHGYIDQRHRLLSEVRNDLRSRNLFRPCLRLLLNSLGLNGYICHCELNNVRKTFAAFLTEALPAFRVKLARVPTLHAPTNVIPSIILPVASTHASQLVCRGGCGSRTKCVCTGCGKPCCGKPECAIRTHNNALNVRYCSGLGS